MTQNSSETILTPAGSAAAFSVSPIAATGAAKWSYFSLVFSVFYFFNLVAQFEHFSTKEVAISFFIYAVFIVLFFQATRLTGIAVIRPILAIILLSAVGASVQPGTNALFGYAAFFAGYYFQFRGSFTLLLCNLGCQFASAYAFDLLSPYYLGPSIAVSTSLFVYGVFSQKEYLNACLQNKKNQQIEQLAAIAERERIARDMHDLLGHSLSSLALKSELAEKLAHRAQFDAAKKEITEVAELARQTLTEVRYAVTGLKQRGLNGSLEKLTKQLQHMNFETQTFIEVTTLPPKVESTVIMLCTEWITNILRHSKGDRVSISITNTSDSVELNIGDNGKTSTLTPGNGIDGMKSRVAEHGGTIDIQQNGGVKLRIVIPLGLEEQTI